MSSSSNEFTLLLESLKTDVSVGFWPPYLRPSKGHQYGISPAGGRGAAAAELGHGVGIWLSLLALGVGHIWIFLRLTWRYLTADSDKKDWDRKYVSHFHASTLHACAVRSGKIWKSWRPTGTSESWVDFTVLSSYFVCFSVFLINGTS